MPDQKGCVQGRTIGGEGFADVEQQQMNAEIGRQLVASYVERRIKLLIKRVCSDDEHEHGHKGRHGRYIRKVINNLRFPGQYYDKETGLHQNYFRDYDPARGAYPQPDPIGLDGGLNLYSYGNNPVKWMDPFGLYTIKKCTIEILFGHHGVIDQHISNETCSAGSVVSCWAGGGADDGVPKSAKDVGNPIPGRTAPGNTPLTIAEGEKIALNDFDAGLKHAQTLCSQPECNKCCDKITVKITCHFGMDIFGRISVGAGICGKNQIIQCRKQ